MIKELSARDVVQKMFVGFSAQNVDQILETVTENSVWVYHGTQAIPRAQFEGKAGVQKFFTNIFERTEMLQFQPRQFIVDGNMVVVLGNEHQRVKRSGLELKQEWVQIYTIKDHIISRMEEFAATVVQKE